MTDQPTPPPPASPLTPEQHSRIYGVLGVGCDRETAANCIGCTLADISQAMREDSDFAKEVRRYEASAELKHMRVVNTIVDDPKNWRASVWWLERRAPERFGSRGAGDVTSRHLKLYLEMLMSDLHDKIHDVHDRERVFAHFKKLQASLPSPVADLWDWREDEQDEDDASLPDATSSIDDESPITDEPGDLNS